MADRAQHWPLMAAAVVVASGLLGWRYLGKTEAQRMAAGPTSIPSVRVAELMPYAAPLSDTLIPSTTTTAIVAASKDPFAPPAAPRPVQIARSKDSLPTGPSESQQWHVTATLVSGTRSAAVINDALVYVGDVLPGGGRLTSVERTRVVVTDPKGIAHTLSVKEGDG